MSWNYRILRTKEGKNAYVFAVYEVYYDEAGAVKAWTESPTHPIGESWSELTRDFAHYHKALQHPIIAVDEHDQLWDIGLTGKKKPKSIPRALTPPGAREGSE